jgi:acyl-CoA reductase-like NAD-dependent aldehyde dehydrogenase
MMNEPILWIGGEPCPAPRAVTIRDPWDGSPAGRAGLGDARDLDRAIAAASAAFETTRHASAAERAGWLLAMAAGLEARREDLAGAIRAEAGKPITLARGEVDRAVITFRTAAEEAKRIGGEVLPLDATGAARGRIGITRRFPVGVVAGIVPFNFPLNLAAHKLAPALAAGCTAVLKPPPQAPGPTLFLGEIAAAAGLPPGAVNVLLVPVEEAGALLTDPRVALLSFTGSARVGWELKARAADRKVVLELGGNAAVIVDETADLAAAAERCAVAGYAYAGQVCIKAQRLLVQRTVYGRFKEALAAAIGRKVVVGDPRREEVICGPVIDDAAAARVTAWTDEALAAGAQAVVGGSPAGRLLAPTLLEGVPCTARAWREEIFGPVMALAPYDRFEEALAAVNDGRYGLQAGVFTREMGRALAAFEGIEAGAVILNDAPTFRVDPMPYGGVKASGFGREGIRWAIEEMTDLRLLVLPPASAD